MTNNIYLEALRELVSVFPVPIAKYPEVCKKVHVALSQKPRNCDVGTAEEQTSRFRQYCSKQHPCEWSCAKKCPLFYIGTSKCEFVWSQMPYEEALEK